MGLDVERFGLGDSAREELASLGVSEASHTEQNQPKSAGLRERNQVRDSRRNVKLSVGREKLVGRIAGGGHRDVAANGNAEDEIVPVATAGRCASWRENAF